MSKLGLALRLSQIILLFSAFMDVMLWLGIRYEVPSLIASGFSITVVLLIEACLMMMKSGTTYKMTTDQYVTTKSLIVKENSSPKHGKLSNEKKLESRHIRN